MPRTAGASFHQQLSEHDGLAAMLAADTAWVRGPWTGKRVKRFEAYLADQGAADEVIDALRTAWQRWQRHQLERDDGEAGEHDVSKFHPHPPSRPPEDMIAVVVTTTTSARTEVVGRGEFLQRMGSEVADRYDGKRYAVLRPSEVRQWQQTKVTS